jgi:hypothetical protein
MIWSHAAVCGGKRCQSPDMSKQYRCNRSAAVCQSCRPIASSKRCASCLAHRRCCHQPRNEASVKYNKQTRNTTSYLIRTSGNVAACRPSVHQWLPVACAQSRVAAMSGNPVNHATIPHCNERRGLGGLGIHQMVTSRSRLIQGVGKSNGVAVISDSHVRCPQSTTDNQFDTAPTG